MVIIEKEPEPGIAVPVYDVGAEVGQEPHRGLRGVYLRVGIVLPDVVLEHDGTYRNPVGDGPVEGPQNPISRGHTHCLYAPTR